MSRVGSRERTNEVTQDKKEGLRITLRPSLIPWRAIWGFSLYL